MTLNSIQPQSEGTHQGEGYGSLLRDHGFQCFLWTQFLGAFNDNVYKMIVSVAAVELAADQIAGSRYLAIAGAVFVIPFLLFAGYAGQLADRYSKTRVLQYSKAFEMVTMAFGIVALMAHSLPLLLVVLFMLATQANFFSPAKYGILPEMLDEARLTKANGLLELSTFAAIVFGTSVGSLLFARWKGEPMVMGGMLLGIAVVGSLASLFIPKVAASGNHQPFNLNPLGDVWAGTKRLLRERALWLTVAGISWFWFLGALFQMTLILVGSETLHLSEIRTGLLVTALAVGIGVGSIAAGWLSGDHVEIGLVPCGAAGLGFSAILAGSAHSFSTMAVCLLLAGFAAGLFIVPLNAFLQDHAGQAEKGRLQATNSFFNMVGVVTASGVLYLLHDVLHFTPSGILVGLGIVTLLATVYIAWVVPESLLRLVIWGSAKIFFNIRIVGAENIPASGRGLIVSNHVSYADAILIACATPRFISFLMWQPLYENKWLHPVVKLFKAIPLAQGSPQYALKALRAARAEMDKGQLVCIFPEGELTRTSHVRPFERGVELIARGDESIPIIPVYLDGLWGHALSLKGGRPFGSGRLRLRHPVTICIGKAMPGGTTAAQLHERVLELGTAAAEYGKTPDATLAHRFVGAAKRNWSFTAVADSTGKKLTFGETLTGALLIRDWVLEQCGDAKMIGLLLPSSVGGALANLGVTLAGKTSVNLNFTAGESEMRNAIARCGITTVLSSRVFLEKAQLKELPGTVFLEDLLPGFTPVRKALTAAKARLLPLRLLAGSSAPDQVAAIIFSSGSTGTPKGVMLSHWNLLSNARSSGEVYSVDRSDCMLGVLPFFHSFGYTYGLWFPLIHGFKAVFHANPTDAKTIGELAAEHRPTLFLSTPTFCLAYIRRCTREQLASIKHLLVGAERLRPKVAAAFEERFGITLLEGYGCTEMGPAVSVNVVHGERSGYKAGSVGRPLPRVSLRIVNPETMAPLAAGETGLLLVNGPARMLGYLGDAERTAMACHDGFYVTGDLAFMDTEGFLHIGDRLSRFSKIAGEMVPHLKLEEYIDEILGSRACVVTGIPDEQRGERLAVLYAGSEMEPAEVWRRLAETDLPKLWLPRRENIYPVESIPTLGTGKLDLRGVQARVLELAGHTGQVRTDSGE